MRRTITIAGGGLAGLSLAIALRQREVPVRVLEAGRYPRHRVCGEFISGVGKETLERLAIADVFRDSKRHRSVAWHDGSRLFHHDTLPSPALGISRFVLDQRLRDLADDLGAEIWENHRAKPAPAEGFVWSAGRPVTGRSKWIGLKAHVRGLPMSADLEMHAGSNGYAGVAGVEDGWQNVCGLFRIDRTLAARGPELLTAYLRAGGNGTLAGAIEAAERRDGSFAAVAGFSFGRQRQPRGLLCLGDAESMIPPFTGNGMSMAFEAAAAAVDPLASWSRGACPWEIAAEEIERSLRKRFRRRLAAAGCLHPLLLAARVRAPLRSLASARVLPFRPMLALVR